MKKLFYSIGIISIICILLFSLDISKDNEVVEKVIERPNNFQEVFKENRIKYGPNDRFRWRGNWYHTNYVEEMEDKDNVR